MTPLLATHGRLSLGLFERLGRGHLFLLSVLIRIPGLLLRPRLLLQQMWSVGVESLLIIVVSGSFVGMVLGLQGKTGEAEQIIRRELPPEAADRNLRWLQNQSRPQPGRTTEDASPAPARTWSSLQTQ